VKLDNGDRRDLREALLQELYRQYTQGHVRFGSRDDGSGEMFLADDLARVVDDFLFYWEEPLCDRAHCPDDCDDSCCTREHRDD
jgi:hypothetical protein